jgi:cytosolic carboxypeptidase protein 2/3
VLLIGLYTLTFTIEMSYRDDDVYLAHCFPYTNADLHSFLTELKADKVRSAFVLQSSLCTTIGGRDVPLLTITGSNTLATH